MGEMGVEWCKDSLPIILLPTRQLYGLFMLAHNTADVNSSSFFKEPTGT